ncbi:hypothetical protein HMPREF1624_06395 [Sporothrix schenckii ATCC 58251]|uniref:Uncharacterized protein n=1 Tax=Sporothrix schenckii (strain ATCC 58251 / de Perez 2211183) TaxID=1391915 RepID=U7PQ61_SPOS1|nr:hypothetical protein HMPREF1624_06395 [Sporothrix schenckii ATCC 58251]
MWIPSTFDEDEDDETTAREALKQPAYVPFPCHSLLLRGQYDKAYIDVSSGLFLDESGWLSKVQTLDLRAVDFTWSRGTLPRNRLGSLRRLRLWHSGMHVLNYKWLLRSMGHPPLSTVSICISDITEEEHRAYATAPPAGTPLYPLPVHLAVQALLPWATTLRCLTHVVTGHTPWPDRHWDLSKLTAFVALEFLWLESAYFYFNPSKTALTDILPPNLVTLRLSGVSLPAAALAHLRDAIVEEAKFLALARVTIDEQGFDLADANEKAVVQSLSLLHDAGIRVTALPQPLPGYEEPADEDDD